MALGQALFNYLAAKQFTRKTGKAAAFIVRIEDTDRTRYDMTHHITSSHRIPSHPLTDLSDWLLLRCRLVPESVSQILRSLRWAGLSPDEAPDIGGPYGPYTQSERLPLYHSHAMKLVSTGSAYPCFCTESRLQALKRSGSNLSYDRHCARLYPTIEHRIAAIAKADSERAASNQPNAKSSYVIRMFVPDGTTSGNGSGGGSDTSSNSSDSNPISGGSGSGVGGRALGQTSVHDLIRGSIAFANAGIDDQVLLKSDGFPTYHLASVVDDHFMQITHVIRGEEWLPSTPKHILLYRMFGWQPPIWCHVPLLLTPSREKLSKRNSHTNIESAYMRGGFLANAVINFVALLGWNPRASQSTAGGGGGGGDASTAAPIGNGDKLDSPTAHASGGGGGGGGGRKKSGAAAAAVQHSASLALSSDEFFPSIDPLMARFSLSKLSSSPSVVDDSRLLSINALHLRYAIANRPDSILDSIIPGMCGLGIDRII